MSNSESKGQKMNWASMGEKLGYHKAATKNLAKIKSKNRGEIYKSIVVSIKPRTVILKKVVDGIVRCGDLSFELKELETDKGKEAFIAEYNRVKDFTRTKPKGGYVKKADRV